jgi:hypothetical protein
VRAADTPVLHDAAEAAEQVNACRESARQILSQPNWRAWQFRQRSAARILLGYGAKQG